jgi:uncharacterized surface protein with fasciclin (FAS1) repeats
MLKKNKRKEKRNNKKKLCIELQYHATSGERNVQQKKKNKRKEKRNNNKKLYIELQFMPRGVIL